MLRIILLLALVFSFPTQGHCITQWNKAKPASGDNLTSWPTDNQANFSVLDTLLANYREGFTISYSSASTIVVSAGEVMVSNSAATLRLMLQKTSSTNVTFSNIDTGAESSGTYYVYAGTSTNTDSAPTFYVSTSSTAPSGVTYYKRLGYFVNDGSNNITPSSVVNDNITVSSLLGDWASKSSGVTYQATADGFVVAYISGYIGNGETFSVVTDSSASPSTTRCSATTPSSTTAFSTGCNVPVKKGDYYQVSETAAAGSAVVFFIPMGS